MLLSSISWKERNTAQELAPLTHAWPVPSAMENFLDLFPNSWELCPADLALAVGPARCTQLDLLRRSSWMGWSWRL